MESLSVRMAAKFLTLCPLCCLLAASAWASEISLEEEIIGAVDGRIAGKTKEPAVHIFSRQDHYAEPPVYVRSPECWAADLDLTCISPWNNVSGNTLGITLISPRHVVGCGHAPIGVGTTVRFVSQDNVVIARTVTATRVIWQDVPDFTVGLLDSDVPTNLISFAYVLPDSCTNLLPTGNDDYAHSNMRLPALCLDQEEKALVGDVICIDARWSEGNFYTGIFTAPCCSDTKRLEFNEMLIGGDSGNPAFWIVDGRLVLLTVWTFGGTGAGTSVTRHKSLINQFMSELNAAAVPACNYQLTEIDLSGYEDKPDLSLITSVNGIAVSESKTVNVRVKMNTAPDYSATTTVAWVSGDPDISVTSGGSLVFDTNNWNAFQTVVLTAAADADRLNGTAIIRCSAPGLTNKDIAVTEQDSTPMPVILTSADGVRVPENETAVFQVRLDTAPDYATTATVERVSGDAGISVMSGGSLVFDAGNWNIYQPVTLAADVDADASNGLAIIRCRAPGLTNQEVTALEADAAAPATVFSDVDQPGVADVGSDLPCELGVRFRSDKAGTIDGIRFYKALANTGPHEGHLWTLAGELLGTVIFTNETASGWQQAFFSAPIQIESNTIYVASYHSENGHYSQDEGYFSGRSADFPPLHMPSGEEANGNRGYYAYGVSGTYPDGAWENANYWVDVIFEAPPVIVTSASGVTVPEGGTKDFQIRLDDAPVGPTTVTVSRMSWDTDITVQAGGSLVFDYSNWSADQIITLSAAADADESAGTSTIACSAPGLGGRFVTATELESSDTDGDGMADDWERLLFGNLDTASSTTDQDGDSLLDWQEFVSGTDPTNETSVFRVDPATNTASGYVFSWPSATGRVYGVYRETNLCDAAWGFWQTNIPATPPLNTWTDSAPVEGSSFYRITVRKTEN